MFFPLHQFPAEKEGKNVLLLVGTPFEEKNTICTPVLILFLFCIRKVLNIFVVLSKDAKNCAKKIIQIIWESKNQNIYLFMLLSLYIAYFRVLRTFQSKFFVENHAAVFLFLYAKLRNDEKMRPNCDQRKSDKMPYINGSDSDSLSSLEWILEPSFPHTTIIMSSTLLVVIQ